MRKLILLIMLFVLCANAKAETLAEGKRIFRRIINEIDTLQSIVSDSTLTHWFHLSQQTVAKIGGNLSVNTEFTFISDSSTFDLPADFKTVEGAMVLISTVWHPCVENPLFIRDGESFTYDVRWSTASQAQIYFRGSEFYPGQTMRVFYKATAGVLSDSTDVFDLQRDDLPALYKEVMLYYEFYKANYAVQQALWEQFRQDMGVERQVTKK